MNLSKLHLYWGESTNKGKKYRSYSLAQSIWKDGSCRKKIVVKLGKLSDEEVIQWREALKLARKNCDHLSANSNKDTELTRDENYLHNRLSTTLCEDNVLEKKKFPYTDQDKSLDIHSYKDAIKLAFTDVIDPRSDDNLRYPFYGLLLSILAGVLAGGSSISAIHQYAAEKANIFSSLLNIDRTPSYTAFWWILTRTDPRALNRAFINWVRLVADTIDCREKKIAIDGKTIRGAKNNPVHYVSGYDCSRGLLLGQVKTEEKSNEIKAIPELLKVIDISGATVTIDAMGCQKSIAADIRERNGHYIIALKGNQGKLEAEAKNFFVQARSANYEGAKCKKYEASNKGHGRIEKREVTITHDLKWLDCRSEWKDLSALIEVKSTRVIKGKTTEEFRYYIASKKMTPKVAHDNIREHWGIENQLHWVLDVLFDDDAVRANTGHAAENLALFRRIAYCILKQETVAGRGLASKKRKAMWNELYVLELLGKFIRDVNRDNKTYLVDS